jgi:hypothetical protein
MLIYLFVSLLAKIRKKSLPAKLPAVSLPLLVSGGECCHEWRRYVEGLRWSQFLPVFLSDPLPVVVVSMPFVIHNQTYRAVILCYLLKWFNLLNINQLNSVN